MDFYRIVVVQKPNGNLHIRPDWLVKRSKDLMTRGGDFYAIWDEENGTWSTDIFDVQRLVDEDLFRHKAELEAKSDRVYTVDTMESNKTKVWDEFKRYLRNSGNNSHTLNEKLVFANTEVKKTDYSSKRLPYALHAGSCPAWNELVGTLYNEEERAKIEWAIGAVVSGDSKKIQKFLVFYGPPASGKSTILNIIEKLFEGYTAVFDARELAGSNNSFATSAFKSNPLVAIQHDGDLSRIYDNTKLNSIVAHEILPVNEKYQKVVEMRANAFLFMGTNMPVKITDAKSGIIRRLIDVVPTQQKIHHDAYHRLMDLVSFELGAIAMQCYERYMDMGANYYSNYRPTEMMLQTDVFYNFVESYFDVFKAEDGVTLKRAWELYKAYCTETGIEKPLPQYKLREELKNYFFTFEERATVNGKKERSYFRGFKHLKPTPPAAEMPVKPIGEYTIELEETTSIFDETCAKQPAQLANADGNPRQKWENVTTTLSDIDTSALHFVRIPENHIVIDFDLLGPDGDKDLEANLAEASKWPATYTEVSKSGSGVHLHYFYYGDVSTLAPVYSEGIEIKTLLGNASLRRKLTKCNRINIATIDAGLPKKEKPVLHTTSITNEKQLRDLIERNLRKEIHNATKPSMDFIKHLLDEAYESGTPYDVRDLRPRLITFAAMSSNQADACLKLLKEMKLVSQDVMPEKPVGTLTPPVFFDIEVYPNLFVVCWKTAGSDTVVKMVNPTPAEITPLLEMPLVGFNNRRYDNHILYARFLGWEIDELYKLSQKIINGGNNRSGMFGEAYNISYADIYDFTTKKQGLKKYMIDLNIKHEELDFPWDEPVAESDWDRVVEYCCNDVVATEAVFEARREDFDARLILSELSGLSPNHSTQTHTARIIFGDEKTPQHAFVYPNLADEFPGYVFERGESTYKGEVVGEGGYVYAEPGMYENVALLDVASMHPTTIEVLNLFGPYTVNFASLKEARMAIKHGNFEDARNMLNGKLAPFLEHEDRAGALSDALKIVINTVYGLTTAKFDNRFKDIRNIDNVVAKRGALFMVDLKLAVQKKGYQVVHIKTDSIKIPNATPEIIEFVKEFGRKYGYDFEHEVTYDKFCLVNDAVFVAFDGDTWKAVGAQFQHPYVFKTLFSHEELVFQDYCETKHVQKGTMYLAFDDMPLENATHVGRTNSFVPVVEKGGTLLVLRDGVHSAVSGTKGYRWVTREMAERQKADGYLEIDWSYFNALAEKAVTQLAKHGDVSSFIT